MPYLTTNALTRLARRRADELVALHRRLPDLHLRAAILYGPLVDPGNPNGTGERDINLVEICESRGVPGMWDRRKLGFDVTEYGSSAQFLIPGVLRIVLTTWLEFEDAARNLHPEILQMFGGRHKVIYPKEGSMKSDIDEAIRQAETTCHRLAGTSRKS